MNIEAKISEVLSKAIKEIYHSEPDPGLIQIQKTRKDFKGDFTVVVFPLL